MLNILHPLDVYARMRGCLGKRHFPNETAAKKSVKAIRKGGRSARFADIEAYQCRFCLQWHLGHPKRKVKVQ